MQNAIHLLIGISCLLLGGCGSAPAPEEIGPSTAEQSTAELADESADEPINHKDNGESREDGSQTSPSLATNTTLVDGWHFYLKPRNNGDADGFDLPNGDYLVFEKQGDRIIGLQYIPHTDNNHCFQGTLVGSVIQQGENAYPPPPGEPEYASFWSFEPQQPMDLTTLTVLDARDIPDYIDGSFNHCKTIFANPDDAAQPSWAGIYTFTEVGEPNSGIVKSYVIEINKTDNDWFATVNVDGFQTLQRFVADVVPDGINRIQLYAREVSDDSFPPVQKDMLLMELEYLDHGIVQVIWGEIQPLLREHAGSFVPEDFEYRYLDLD